MVVTPLEFAVISGEWPEANGIITPTEPPDWPVAHLHAGRSAGTVPVRITYWTEKDTSSKSRDCPPPAVTWNVISAEVAPAGAAIVSPR